MSYNKVILEGNATDAAELKQSPSGKSVCSFTLAVDRYAPTDQEKKTDFFRIVVWGSSAEYVSRTVSKGAPVLFAGSVQTRSWTDRQGNKRIETEFVAEHIRVFGRKAPASQGNTFEEVPFDDTVPF